MRNNLLVAQSGGPSTAINSSLSGVVLAALESEKINQVYGAFHGVEGIFNENLLCFNDVEVDEIRYLKTTPSSALGSCRYKLTKDEEYDRIIEVCEKYDIGYFFYIGGNDSMDTVNKMSILVKERNLDLQVIGIPKTIDNDLFNIDHTPGFGSAAKYLNTSIAEVYRDAICYDKKQVIIMEVMGRNAGWLAAATCLAKEYHGAPHYIYLPENDFTLEQFKSDIDKAFETTKVVVIVISEGIKYPNGKYVSETESAYDGFGHAKLGGAAGSLKEFVEKDYYGSVSVRAIEFNTLQRAAMHCASLIDIEEAFDLGRCGVQYAEEGMTGVMSSLERISSLPYQIKYKSVPVSEVANFEKIIPPEHINEFNNGITRAGFEYFLPLIQGEVAVHKVDGLPRYSKIRPFYDPKK